MMLPGLQFMGPMPFFIILVLSGIGCVGAWAWRNWQVVKIGPVKTTPAMAWAVMRSGRRQAWLERRLEEVEDMERGARGAALNELLERCDDLEEEAATKIMERLMEERRDREALARMARTVRNSDGRLAFLLARILAQKREAAADGEVAEILRESLARALPRLEASDHEARAVALALFTLNKARAWEVIRPLMAPGRPAFGALLELVQREDRAPEEALIREWLRVEAARRIDSGRSASADEVRLLALLAKTRREEAQMRLQEIMRLPDFPATMAAEALIELHDLPHPRGSLMDWVDEDGLECLSPDEATTYLADRCSYYVAHQLADTLLEDSGAELPQMRDALLRVGAPGGAELIEKIIAVLPPGGLPKDKDERLAYLRGEGHELEHVVFRLMHDHDYRREEIHLLALRHAVEHRAGFRRV